MQKLPDVMVIVIYHQQLLQNLVQTCSSWSREYCLNLCLSIAFDDVSTGWLTKILLRLQIRLLCSPYRLASLISVL
jgi:hypothetical protein